MSVTKSQMTILKGKKHKEMFISMLGFLVSFFVFFLSLVLSSAVIEYFESNFVCRKENRLTYRDVIR